MSLVKQTFYIENSQFVLGSGLKDQANNDAYINDAVLTATLNDSTGTPITGASNMTGTYVAASNGNYSFQVDGSTFNPSATFTATLVIDGTYSSGSKRFHAELPAIIKVRNQGTET